MPPVPPSSACLATASRGSISSLQIPDYCAGKFPVASDATGKIAASYNLTTAAPKPDAKDVRGVAIDHDFIERETFVIGKDHKIIATFSSKDDNLSPDQHVTKSLAIVQQLTSK